MQFIYYTLNYDRNRNQIIKFNIFFNKYVNNNTEKIVKKYLRQGKKFAYNSSFTNEQKFGFEAFCTALDHIIKMEEWGRCEYEIVVGSPFYKNIDECTKICCYDQAVMNIETIAREVIYQYKQYKKGNMTYSDAED